MRWLAVGWLGLAVIVRENNLERWTAAERCMFVMAKGLRAGFKVGTARNC